MNFTLDEITEIVYGEVVGENVTVSGAAKDSREVEKGDLFVAISGERDAHDFIPKAVEAGAAAVLVERFTADPIPQVKVVNARLALGDLARECCKRADIPKIAVTGSAGKTTTRDMTAAVLRAHFENVLCTKGNYNNDIGLPITALRLKDTDRAAVFEMGMNHFGEIDYLTNIVHPDIAVITNVGTAHIENLGSREGILKAKCEIFNGMKPEGVKILNGDNDMLATVKGENIRFYSVKENGGDIYASNIRPKGLKGTEFTVNTKDTSFDVYVPLPGIHSVSNALAAAAVGLECGLAPEEIAKGLSDFVPTSGRLDIYETPRYTIIDGTYNANPDSVKAGIEVLEMAEGFKCAILGDMLELGAHSDKLHAQVGKAAEKLDLVVAIGKLAWNIYDAAGENAVYFENMEVFLSALEKTELIPRGANVLVKASHSMHFEKIVEFLKNSQK